MATAFFNPASPFGTLTGWEVQTNNVSNTRQRAQALKSTGDEQAYQTFDEKTSVSATYTCSADEAAVPVCGDILNGYHVDNIAIQFSNTAFVSMTITGHKHGSSSHDACRTYTGSLTTIASAFGCPSSICGFSAVPAGTGIRSISYNLSCNHVDENGSSGAHIGSGNYDGSETVTVDCCDSGDFSAASGWTVTTDGKNYGNTVAETSTATAEHHIQGTAVSAS